MAKAPTNQDHLTTDGPSSTPAPEHGAGAESEALPDDSAPSPGRVAADTTIKPESNQDKPTITLKSPGDIRREKIIAANREAYHKEEEVPEENRIDLKAATYGTWVSPPTEDAAGEALTEAEGEPKGGATSESHGNKKVDIIVNRVMMSVPMSSLRQVLIENNIDPSGVPDDAVVASAKTILAARDRLAKAKQGVDVDEEPAPQARPARAPKEETPAQPQFNLKDRVKKVVEDLQYGDPDEAADRMTEVIAIVAAEAASHLMVQRDQSLEATHRSESSRTIEQEYASKEDVKQILKQHGQTRWDTARLMGGFNAITEELVKVGVDRDEVMLLPMQERGKLYTQLRSQGASLPSEAEIVRRGHEEAISLLGAKREPSSQSRTPAVNLSNERIVRREAVSAQPRASSVVPQVQPSVAQTRSETIAQMRNARPHQAPRR